MKSRFLAVCVCLWLAATASAQEPGPPVKVWNRNRLPYPKSFSLELGTGLRPLHMLLVDDSGSLSDTGQEAASDWNPLSPSALSLSGVYRHDARSEFILTGGLAWTRYWLTQYSAFGFDPQGRPRYDHDSREDVWKVTRFKPTLTLSYRYILNPGGTVEWYTGFGFGLVYLDSLKVLPGLTLFGLRTGGEHIYFFAENTFSPIATLVHGGLGWRF